MVSFNRTNLFQAHPFHLVSPSPWPLLTSISLFCVTTSTVFSLQGYHYMTKNIFLSLIMVTLSMSLWFRDIIAESTYKGDHTNAVQRGINIGVGLFIVSEALFFLAIFWTFFHSSFSTAVDTGGNWPATGVDTVDALEVPIGNTIILLGSGFAVTFAHHFVIAQRRGPILLGLIVTVCLALIFTVYQGDEYLDSIVNLSDSSFGSSFYFGTGFHGFHVIIGTVFLAVGLWRSLAYHFTNDHHLGLEAGILYWHFVDIVWLVLYCTFYYWGA